MSLLREIQDAATGEDISLAVVLRRCLVLAARLDHEPLKEWAKQELNGYEKPDSLPEYRRFATQARGTFVGPFGASRTNQPIPPLCIDPQHHKVLFDIEMQEGVASIESLVKDGEGQLSAPWPSDAVAYYQDKILETMSLVSAHKLVSRSALVGILDTIRSRLLEFALDIERENPDAGEAVPGTGRPPVPEGTVSHIFNTTILGGHNVVQAGPSNVIESVQSLGAGDWETLARAFADLGVSAEELAELRSALDADDNELGPETQSWMGRVTARALSGGMHMAGGVAAQVIGQGLAAYLGLG